MDTNNPKLPVPKPNAPSIAEKLFVIMALLLSTGAFLNLSTERIGDESGLAGMQFLWTLVYIVIIFLQVRHGRETWRLIRNEFWLIALLGLVLSSVYWSDDPTVTLRRAIALIGTTLFGFYLGQRYTLREQLRLLAVVFLISAVMSILFQLLGLGTAVDEGVPGWIGIYVQKNQLGEYMAMATLVFLIIYRSDSAYRSLAVTGTVLSGFLLLFSRSMTAVVVLGLVLFVLFPIRRILTGSYRRILLAAAIIVPVCCWGAVWAFRNIDRVTGVIGKDPTLSGRLPLWVLSAFMALQRPWLGYGYNAFWRGKEGASAAIWRVLKWNPPHSHDGFLELWLGIGLFGCCLFLVGFLFYVRRAVLLIRRSELLHSAWPFVFLAWLFVSNLTEANLMSRNNLFWIQYVAVGVTSARYLSDSTENANPHECS